MRGRAWTDHDIQLARTWAAEKVPLAEIAAALDRTLNSVKEKIYRAYRYTRKERKTYVHYGCFSEEKIRESSRAAKQRQALYGDARYQDR